MATVHREGQRYGRLTAVRRAPNRSNEAAWECHCDCGRIVVVRGYLLGRTQSCGCLREASHFIHGATKNERSTKEYAAWSTAKGRCMNPRNARYETYGARGITMCERWFHDFAAFLEDMGPAPLGSSLDRIDNNADYEPGNCRWTTRDRQANNKTNNRRVTLDGIDMSLADAVRVMDMPYSTVVSRIHRGWTPERALTEPISHRTPTPRVQ